MWWRPWKRNRELEDRVKEAEKEVKVARSMLDRARIHVVLPLASSDEHDSYSDTIREALLRGRGGEKTQP